jgi:CBS domain-containing protein
MVKMEFEKYIIADNQLIEQAIEIIEMNNSRCVVVVNAHKRVVGVLSEGDVLRAILKGVSILSPVKNVMITHFQFMLERDDMKIKELLKKGITLIPVLNDQHEMKDIVVFTEYVKDKW